MNDGSLTRLAREHARGLLTEAAEEARELARADLVDQLRRAIVAEALRAAAAAPGEHPANTAPGVAAVDDPAVDRTSQPDRSPGHEPAPANGARPAAGLERCLYAYAITDRADLDFAELDGTGDGLRCIGSEGLALVVSDMAVSDLADLPTDEITEDGPLARLARKHDDVVRVAAGQATVLPLRLGTAVADDDAARELLHSRGESAREQLAELRGRREWGVQFLPDDQAKGVPDSTPTPSPAAARTGGSPSGTAYLTQRREALAAEERRRRDRTVAIDRAHDRLSARSSASVRRSANAGVLADVAYLVAADDEAAFQAELGHLAHPLSASGVAVRLTGPWPPYSFVSSEEG
ncbi:GvpL/GvpF family gas vesicle protein [Thermocrispum agreste]|uniref:GvpL/GvpF family gas vesicle protein n=1 Tax=Thermocrispum agreste TaxID=37925 RepID=UPI00041A65E4|nr:GvpL/GvpF family gas vesicle protein [Thermocrispum agreste]